MIGFYCSCKLCLTRAFFIIIFIYKNMSAGLFASMGQGVYNGLSSIGATDFILPTMLGGMEAAELVAIEKTMRVIQDKIMPQGVNIGAEDFGPFGSIIYWDKIYKSIRDTNQALGVSGDYAQNMETVIQSTYESFRGIGGSIDELVQSYEALSNLTSVNRLLSEDDLNNIAKLRVAFGEGFEEIFANLSIYGSSVDNAAEQVEKSFIKANKMGINASKVLKSIRDNIGLLDKFSFRNGIQGLEKMVMLSERYKLNIQNTTGAIEGLNDLDQSLEVTAKLLSLGGDFAQMADPFTLMFEARNNPEQLMERMIDLASSYAKFDTDKGFFTVDPYAMDQIREASNIFGLVKEDIVAASKIKALEGTVSSQLSQDLKTLENYDELLSKVASNAFFDQKSKEFGVNVSENGQVVFKSISELNQSDLKALETINQNSQNSYDELILSNESLTSSLDRLAKQIKGMIIPETMYQQTEQIIRPVSEQLRNNDVKAVEFFKERYENNTNSIIETAKERIGMAVDGNFSGLAKELYKFNPIMYGLEGLKDFFTPKSSSMSVPSINIPNVPNPNTQGNNKSTGIGGRIEMGDINGKIDLNLNEEYMSSIDVGKLMEDITPMIEKKVRSGVYNEVDNRLKDNPKRGSYS